MILLKTLTPCELIVLSNIVAFTIAKDTEIDDLEIIGNFISLVANNILAIASQEQVLAEVEENKKQIEDLQNQITTLKKKL